MDATTSRVNRMRSRHRARKSKNGRPLLACRSL